MMNDKKIPKEEIFNHLVNCLEICLFELDEARPKNGYEEAFIDGERLAYIECLEILQKCEDAAEFGLDYDIEERHLKNR